MSEMKYKIKQAPDAGARWCEPNVRTMCEPVLLSRHNFDSFPSRQIEGISLKNSNIPSSKVSRAQGSEDVVVTMRRPNDTYIIIKFVVVNVSHQLDFSRKVSETLTVALNRRARTSTVSTNFPSRIWKIQDPNL